MNLSFSEEQNMLKDSVARFVADQYDFETRRKIADSAEGFSRENWQTFAELGWLSIPFSEELGGFGGGAADTMVVMEEMGKGLVVEPFVATVLLFGGLLSKAGSEAQQQELIGKIIEGQLQGTFAFLERQSRFEIADILTTAKAEGDSFILNGEKTVVMNGANADKLIVSARTSGAQSDEQGISLFLVDANADGVEKVSYKLMDGQLVANIKLNGVTGELVGEQDKAFDAIQAVVNDVMVAVSAEALGIMEKLVMTTIEYAKTREQFGITIGKFQALQHRMVEMFMAGEQTKSLLYRAVCSLEGNSEDAQKDILALKVMVGRAGKQIGGEAIQMHGGMGITDELDVGHYVKRLMTINTLFGDADYQQQRFEALTNA
ncbi:pimeloyl-CoA dehydrogenase small subunit [Maricurvus nonylphenolicus]|uniref:acyl-CoA dehydrogenase family protein n=1 Tax=Maricurvus nonylphenolicus TaxID=1008307 RepID=UPI0036F23130